MGRNLQGKDSHATEIKHGRKWNAMKNRADDETILINTMKESVRCIENNAESRKCMWPETFDLFSMRNI